MDDVEVFKEAMLERPAEGSSEETAVSNEGKGDKGRKEESGKLGKRTDGERCLPLRREEGSGRKHENSHG